MPTRIPGSGTSSPAWSSTPTSGPTRSAGVRSGSTPSGDAFGSSAGVGRYGAASLGSVHGAKEIRTSKTHPQRVIWVPGVDTPGKLGLTIAPGKSGPSKSAHVWQRDLDADLDRIAKHYGGDVLVPLIEDHELKMLQIEALVPKAKAHGLEVDHFPIKDLGAPAMAPTKVLAKKLAADLKAGKDVVIHCRGGNGRTGTIAVCAMIELGMSANQALKLVRSVRPNAVETSVQEKFVHDYAFAQD
jgi:ADP-ribosyl-[dinitrogen reductase] hydrolase